jgi:hypothetical protein
MLVIILIVVVVVLTGFIFKSFKTIQTELPQLKILPRLLLKGC